MRAEATIRKPLLDYFALTYLIFLVLFGATGATIALNTPKIIPDVLQVVCAWSPTFAFLILYRRLSPDLGLADYVKRQFSPRVSCRQIVAVVGIQVLVFVSMIAVISIMNRTPVLTVVNVSSSIAVLGFFNHLIRGPLGEELGWRGYALNRFDWLFARSKSGCSPTSFRAGPRFPRRSSSRKPTFMQRI